MGEHPTKIGQLRAALQAGQVMTPLSAWERFRMNSSTYHRCIWEMVHKEGLAVKGVVVTEANGIRHSTHWMEIPGALAPAQPAAVAG